MNALPALISPPAFDQQLESGFLALAQGLDPGQLRYIAGFLAGVAAERERLGTAANPATARQASAEGQVQRASVLYASQTGNGRRVAEKLHRLLESQGLAARLVNIADYKPRDLAAERLLYLVASTHGDGEPPDDARALLEFLQSRKAPKLEQLHYHVLALGDSSYPQFCATGRAFDERLAALGAQRLGERVEADVDFEATAETWSQEAVRHARERLHSPHLAIVSAPVVRSEVATREAPVAVELLATQRISARSSDHPVMHLELAAPADRLPYEPGDAVGIWHENPALVVERLIELTQGDAAQPIVIDGQQRSLHEWLTRHRDVTRLARPFLDTHAARAASSELDARRAPGSETLRNLLRDWQPLDVLEAYPARWSADELVRALRPLTPRLYSIASSRASVGDELHLTVASVDYQHQGQRRLGAASHYLTGSPAGALLRAYVEPNSRFRLPEDSARDIIMIGPGTGVAPFRGFLQQRIESGARGRNWLFFGARHRFADFLYQSEWLEARGRSQLQRLDVAFSRDQADKIYVQHRIREQGAELVRWIENGAHLYVCGDAQHMAADVHAALIDILTTHTARSAEDAAQYLGELTSARRYARDVY